MIQNFHKTAIIAGERNISYTELLQRIDVFASLTSKCAPTNNDGLQKAKTMIFSENREGWIYAFFSVWQNRGIAVPVDASSTVSDVAYIINDCRPEAAWVSRSHEDIVREAMEKVGHKVELFVIDDYENQSLASEAWHEGDGIQAVKPDGSECAVIIYTSGTTGSPKGVMLSYANLWANLHGVCEEVKIFNGKRRTLILLPLHHILPLMGTVIAPITMGDGVAICPSMSGPDIMETLCRGKIAIFIGVPRLWQTLYTGIKKKIDASPVTRTLFNICAKAKNPRLSKFVFQSIRKKMGGNIAFCVSGGAALDREIGEGLRTLGLDVLEGYGMSETAPIISFTRPGDIIPGCVGLPLPSVECKIVNGELCAKGPNVMMGYYNRAEETAAVIDKDGFIHTGDLARFDEKGRVYITGRSKEIIVLSNGKNVQPAEIEFQMEKYDSIVKECAVTEKDDMLLAIIVPQEQWAAGLTESEMMDKLKREVVEPYNLTVENYKKVMRIFVYCGDLPRTKLDKLQRFKLKDIVNGVAQPSESAVADDYSNMPEEFLILKKYIEEEKKLPVTPASHIETDLAFDSLDKVGLQGFIENTFGMEINADTMASFANIQAIADHIAKQKTRTEVEETDWHSIMTNDSSSLVLPHTSPLFRVHARAFKAFFCAYNRLKVVGEDNIPANGPFILAANHQSYMDGPLVMAGVKWNTIPDCYFYATEEHVQGKVRKTLAHRNNVILMERRNLKNSILKLAEVLKQGKNIVIFPEGSRTHTGKTGAYKKTFAILSKELGVPVVPVKISGAFDAMPRGTHYMKPKKITVEYFPAVKPTAAMSYDDIVNEVRSKA